MLFLSSLSAGNKKKEHKLCYVTQSDKRYREEGCLYLKTPVSEEQKEITKESHARKGKHTDLMKR